MFQRKKVIPLAVSGGIALFFCLFSQSLFAASRQPVSNLTTIKGRITEDKTTKAVASASVEIKSVAGKIIVSVTTDSTGAFYIRKEVSGAYFVYMSCAGYITKFVAKYFKKGSTYTINLSLKPEKRNTPPRISSFTPKHKFKTVVGDELKIDIKASDLDRDKLEYRYLIDSRIVSDWRRAASYKFRPVISDRGRHKIRVEVRDNKGGQDTRSADIYIYRKFPHPG